MPTLAFVCIPISADASGLWCHLKINAKCLHYATRDRAQTQSQTELRATSLRANSPQLLMSP